MSTSWYLAGSYGRRAEIAGYAAELVALGDTVTSRWLANSLDNSGTIEDWTNWARADFSDLDDAQGFIAFTEEPGNKGRGGRHVELGIALGRAKHPIVIVGPVESMFYMLGTEQHETWDAFKARDREATNIAARPSREVR